MRGDDAVRVFGSENYAMAVQQGKKYIITYKVKLVCWLKASKNEYVNFYHHFLWYDDSVYGISVAKSLWPCNAIWWHRSGSTLGHVMACCLMAPSHCLNWCQIIIKGVLWHSPESNFTRSESCRVSWNFRDMFLTYLICPWKKYFYFFIILYNVLSQIKICTVPDIISSLLTFYVYVPEEWDGCSWKPFSLVGSSEKCSWT